MTDQARIVDAGSDDGDLEDVAVVTTGSPPSDVAPQEDVVRAIRYLLYRHELTTGSTYLPQMIAVVSAAAGEGVTTVSRTLAHVLASERGTQVCWIDVADSNELPPALGRGSSPELPAISRTLHKVEPGQPLGKPDPTGIRLLAQGTDAGRVSSADHATSAAELDDMLNGLAGEYRHIIFDTPPLLSRIDSIGFLRHAEAYILVTKQGSTTLNQIRMIAEDLRPIPSLGAILNSHRTRAPRFVRRFFRE